MMLSRRQWLQRAGRGGLTLTGCLALAGCHGLPTMVTLPGRNSLILGQLVIQSDMPLPKQHRLLDELVALRDDVSKSLSLPTSEEPIHVFLFDSQQEFRDYMQRNHPSFPTRRAFFVETDTRLAVYAFWGDRVAEDLWHEVSHGYLHAVVPNLPLWLDEGLAENFEVTRGANGVNRPHLDELMGRHRQGTWKPDLARLERLTDINDMEQLEYAESWAWIHFLLHSTPQRRGMVQAYLQALRDRIQPPPLSMQMRMSEQDAGTTLVEYLTLLEKSAK